MASKATQAILLQDVEKLGRKGDVVHVAAGYMRNYLGPRKLAEAATDARVAEVERQAEQRRRHEAQGEEQARDMAHTLNRTVLTIKRRAGTEDRLYGSVTVTLTRATSTSVCSTLPGLMVRPGVSCRTSFVMETLRGVRSALSGFTGDGVSGGFTSALFSSESPED